MSTNEKRQFTRVAFVTQIKLTQGQQLWLGHVVDISFKGVLVTSREPLNFNSTSPIIAEISFDNGSSMALKVEEAHRHDQYYGFTFLEYDIESMTHLRNIIMYNIGDDTICQRELISLFSYHQ